MDSKQQYEREADVAQSRAEHPAEATDRLLNEFWEWLKREKIPAHGWITAIASVALLGVTFGQLVIACNNYVETSPLVGYAEKTSNAADRFATAAGGINVGVGNAVAQLGNQVGKLGNGVDQTQRVADATVDANKNASNAERPWLFLSVGVPSFEKDKKSTAYVQAGNVGRRPAKIIDFRYQANAFRTFPQNPSYLLGRPSQGIMVPGQPANGEMDISNYTADPWFTNIQGPDWTLYIYAYVSYEDLRDHSVHHTWACYFYNAKAEHGTKIGFYNCDNNYGNAD
jgi:hypothetical protein